MKILILTQYFPPETGAPQNRLHSLAGYFSNLGSEVSILTAMPNYPQMEVFDGYKGKFYKYEEQGKLIHLSDKTYLESEYYNDYIPIILSVFI